MVYTLQRHTGQRNRKGGKKKNSHELYVRSENRKNKKNSVCTSNMKKNQTLYCDA